LPFVHLHRIGRYYHARTRRHARRILKTEDAPPPMVWMIICSLGTVAPLLVGTIRVEVPFAIYGALAGYFIGLSDHRGSLLNRLVIATLSFITNALCFSLGILWHQKLWIFVPFSLVAAYGLRLFGGKGAELERLLLFSLINLMVARYAFWIAPGDLPSVIPYFLIAYSTAIAVILISQYVHPEYQGKFLPAQHALRQAFTLNPLRHFYSFAYLFTVGISILCVECLHMPRGYWTVITVLLILKPDHKESFYRVFQRLFGSILGVIAGELLILIGPPLSAMIGISFLCALLVPYVWNRNYWLVTFLATLLVISLLSMALYGHLDNGITWFRLQATLAGCFISLLSLWVFQQLEKMIPKQMLHD